MTFDVRSIANLVLETSKEEEIAVTNLSLNKIVFFLHAETLLETTKPLVSSKIEAWKYGPVFRELYSQFKEFGDQPIKRPATHINRANGKIEPYPIDMSEHFRNIIKEKCAKYLTLSAFQLVNLSHVAGGAWDKVYNHDSKSNPGMSITNEIIRETFAQPSIN